MPAVSEPALPHTWRPLGVRLAVLFFGGLLAIVCVAGWIAVGADVRAKVTPYQLATLVLFAAMAVAVAWALVRCRVTASTHGLEVVNGYRTHRYEWAEVLAVHMPQGAPFPTLDLADGTSRAALGIQASDGDRARHALAELRMLLARIAEESLQRPDPPAD
jgi:PH (Pleckstrin Homology) domain-containing protein